MEQINSKLLNWASVLDEKTRDQAVLASSMPFIHPHLALMPDAHLGMGATVGSVIPTLEAVMPAAVGVDIGCGMIAVQSQFNANFTQQEHNADKDVWVSRKGAIEVQRGTKGIIPGSMGTASYVVEGYGNEASLYSSPHGAGRQNSRNSARKNFTQDQLREAMKGIEYRDTIAFIEEIPAAYKDIDQIMKDAKDLVNVTHTLRQFVNCKGD